MMGRSVLNLKENKFLMWAVVVRMLFSSKTTKHIFVGFVNHKCHLQFSVIQ